ncbi:MAG: hypothetical protein ACI9OJ_003036, partial [Myxococcota bacterium]
MAYLREIATSAPTKILGSRAVVRWARGPILAAVVTLCVAGCRRDEPVKQSTSTVTPPGSESAAVAPPKPASESPPALVAPPGVAPVSPKPPVKPLPAQVVVDRLRTSEVTRLSVTRGGRFVTVELGSGDLQLFDGARGRLVLERRVQIPAEPTTDAKVPGVGPTTRLCRGKAVSPDGRRALVRGGGRVVSLELGTGTIAQDYSRLDGGSARCTFSGDGLSVVVGTREFVEVLDSRTATSRRRVETRGFDRVSYVGTDGSARTLFLIGYSGGRLLARAHGGQGGDVWRDLEGFDGQWPLHSTASGRLVAGMSGTTTTVWDAWSGKVTKRFENAVPIGFLALDQRLALHANGSDSAAASGGALRFAEVEDWQVGEAVPVVGDSVNVALTDDGRRLFVAGIDGGQNTFGHWNLVDGQKRFLRSEPVVRVRTVAYRGRSLEIACDLGTLTLDAETGLSMAQPPPAGERVEGEVDGVWWTIQQRASHSGRDLLMTDGRSGKLLWSRRAAAPIAQSAVTGDGTQTVTLLNDGGLEVRDAATGEGIDYPETPTADVMTTLPKGRAILLANRAAITQVGSDLLLELPIDGLSPAAIAVNSTGSTAAIVSGRSVLVIALESPMSLACRFPVPLGVRALGLSPDGERIAVSTGVDVEVYNRCGGLRSRVAIVAGATLAAVVTDSAGENFASSEPSAPVRWR